MKSKKIVITSEKLKVFALSILFMYVMNPFYLSSIESISKLLYYIFIISTFMILVFKTGKLRLAKLIYDQITYFAFYIICILCVMAINHSRDISYIVYFFRILLGILGIYVVYLLWKVQFQKRKISISLVEIYIIANIIYIITTFSMIIFPTFKELWLSLISMYERDIYLNRPEYITRVGVSGFAGFGVSIQIICALIALIFLSELGKIYSLRRNVYYMILLMGSFFYGRICLVMFMCITVLWLGFCVFFHANTNFLLISLFALTLIIIFGIIFIDKVSRSDSDYWKWILEPIINYHLSDKFSSNSLNALLNSYRSVDYSYLIYYKGTAKFVDLDGHYSAGSDSGLLQKIYFGGLFYTVIHYGIIYQAFKKFCNFIKQEARNTYKFLMCILVSTFIICELKGDVIFFFLKIITIMHLGLVSESRENNK